jgi:hypothetical protein
MEPFTDLNGPTPGAGYTGSGGTRRHIVNPDPPRLKISSSTYQRRCGQGVVQRRLRTCRIEEAYSLTSVPSARRCSTWGFSSVWPETAYNHWDIIYVRVCNVILPNACAFTAVLSPISKSRRTEINRSQAAWNSNIQNTPAGSPTAALLWQSIFTGGQAIKDGRSRSPTRQVCRWSGKVTLPATKGRGMNSTESLPTRALVFSPHLRRPFQSTE